MYYVFNQQDLEKATIERDDMAVTMLWDKSKEELLAATRLTMKPHDADAVVAMAGSDVVELHKFSSGALDAVGIDFIEAKELCNAMNKEFGGFIQQRKKDVLKANAA